MHDHVDASTQYVLQQIAAQQAARAAMPPTVPIRKDDPAPSGPSAQDMVQAMIDNAVADFNAVNHGHTQPVCILELKDGRRFPLAGLGVNESMDWHHGNGPTESGAFVQARLDQRFCDFTGGPKLDRVIMPLTDIQGVSVIDGNDDLALKSVRVFPSKSRKTPKKPAEQPPARSE